MALPAIFRRLFRDNGYSSLLKPEIVPITDDAASSATDVAASPSLVHSVANNYIKDLSISGRVITYTKGSGATGTLTTQDTNTTYSAATQSANGLMSAADKKKLDGMKGGAGTFTLVANWQGAASNNNKWIDKTITGCVVGQPVLLLVKGTYTGGIFGIGIKVTGGSAYGTAGSDCYYLGTSSDGSDGPGAADMIIIPNATTVSLRLWDFEEPEYIGIYR